MRYGLPLLLCLILSACNQHTTNEFVKASVNFHDIDWYAKRAQLAYQSEQEISATLDQVIHIETIPELDIQFFIEQLPNQRQLISIRGTANLANVREDLEYAKSRNNKIHILVHDGFDRDTNTVFQRALPHLDKRQQIITTGHSLGAAISTLLTIYLYHDGFKVGPSVNFGQPKFTNKQGAKTYDFLNLTRVVNKDDPVPLLPPASLFDTAQSEYHHFGQEVILLNGPNFVFLDNHINLKKDLSELWFNLDGLNVEDHKINNYRSSIQEKLTQQHEVPFKQRTEYYQTAAIDA